MRTYLAGPMRGYPRFNFPAFHAAAADLRARGWEVYNPAERDEADGFDPDNGTPKSPEYYMAIDLPEVLKSDTVVVLPGWRGSEGARKESTVAQWAGKPVLDYARGLEPISETILEEATRLTSADRASNYGHPRDNFECIAAFWTAYLHRRGLLKPGREIEPRDHAQMMVLVKVARDAHRPHRDNLVDIAGYVRTAERLEEQA